MVGVPPLFLATIPAAVRNQQETVNRTAVSDSGAGAVFGGSFRFRDNYPFHVIEPVFSNQRVNDVGR